MVYFGSSRSEAGKLLGLDHQDTTVQPMVVSPPKEADPTVLTLCCCGIW